MRLFIVCVLFVCGGTVRSQPSPLRVGGKPLAPVLNIGHRGARAFAPENTLESFVKATQFGCHMIELDVHLTKDGELLVVHDDDLLRCSNVKDVFPDRSSYFVSDFTAVEIRKLDAGTWYVRELEKPAARRQPYLQGLTARELKDFITDKELTHYASGKVVHPTLAEVLETAHKHRLLVNIEIKTLPRLYPGIADKVVALVEKLKMECEVIVSSFDHEQLALVRRKNKVIPTGVLFTDRPHNPGRYIRDLLDGDAYNPGCDSDYDTLGFASTTGKIDTTTIQNALKAGLAVQVWTENDPARMAALIDAGVTGIFTDYPNRLKAVLEARKK
jgi:glycerophosphoryl diester phosphodiesterase